MAGNISDQDDGEITGINVTPLVDVMLVLLIVFMVTSTYIVQQSIQVQLPKADTGENTPRTKNLAFVIDKAGTLYLDGKSIAIEQIAGRVQQLRSEDAKVQIQALISADESTPHGQVVKLIDAVRQQGIVDLAINVERSSLENAKK